MRFLSLRSSTIAAALLVALPARADIVVGVAAPLSGEFAMLGLEMRDGAAQAVADINAAGGVNGDRLALEVMDDSCTAKKADAVANQLAGKGASLVVGHLCLKASAAGAAVYASEHIVQISPGTTFPLFTDKRAGPGLFRLAGRDDAQGTFAGEMMAAKYHSRKVAIVDDRTSYGSAIASATVAAMAAAGMDPTLRDSYDPGAKEYLTLVSRLQGMSIDAVYIAGSGDDAGLIASEMREAGLATDIVGSDTLLDDDYGSVAGAAADGTVVSYPSDPAKLPAAATVAAEFTAKTIDPSGYILPAYAAVQAWAEAATAANSTAYDKVSAALQSGTFKTAIGDVSFDEKGDMRDSHYDWYVWQGGVYHLQGM